MDVLDTFPEIQVGVTYKIDGKPIDYFPSNQTVLAAVEVRFLLKFTIQYVLFKLEYVKLHVFVHDK